MQEKKQNHKKNRVVEEGSVEERQVIISLAKRESSGTGMVAACRQIRG